jgi:hypothetical protein
MPLADDISICLDDVFTNSISPNLNHDSLIAFARTGPLTFEFFTTQTGSGAARVWRTQNRL